MSDELWVMIERWKDEKIEGLSIMSDELWVMIEREKDEKMKRYSVYLALTYYFNNSIGVVNRVANERQWVWPKK